MADNGGQLATGNWQTANGQSPIRVLLTVAHMTRTAHPYHTMMAIAKYLPRDEFALTICSLREHGFAETQPLLREMGVESFVANFRPRKPSPRWNIAQWVRYGAAFMRDTGVIARRGPFDIQHSLDFVPWPVEAIASRRIATHFIFSQRNLNQGGSAAMLRSKIQRAEHITAISQGTADLLLAHGAKPDQVQVVYEGIDLETLPPLANREQRNPTDRYILNVGQIQQLKRQEDVIRAFAAIKDEQPDLRLKLAGAFYERDYSAKLQALVRELGIEARVEFLGARTDVLDLMQRAECLVHCSDSEALGRVLIEAMAVGCPVIAAASEGPREIVRDSENGRLLPIADVGALVDALRGVLSQPERASQMAACAYDDVQQKYSAETMVAQIAQVYRTLVGAGLRPAPTHGDHTGNIEA
jgi:glycosyltransferase involved in cell wall biosynthesis